MGMYDELNKISRVVKENQNEAERLQKSSDSKQTKKEEIYNALLASLIEEIESGNDIYNDDTISYICDSISKTTYTDQIEYIKKIYYTTASSAERIVKKSQVPGLTPYQAESLKLARERLELQAEKIRKKEVPNQKELTPYQAENLKLAKERLELQRQKIQANNQKKEDTPKLSKFIIFYKLLGLILTAIIAPIILIIGLILSIAGQKK